MPRPWSSGWKRARKFEDVAKQVSLDGSRDYGGDLGFFTAGEMVPEFSKAVFAMKKGDVSPPVKTDFGWHIIRLEDVQEGGAQPFDSVKDPIRLVLLRKAVQDKVIELRTTGKIEVLDDDLKRLQDEAREEARSPAGSRQGAGGTGCCAAADHGRQVRQGQHPVGPGQFRCDH
jgi:peptidyl-prolyl cis-trans isomerase C